MVALRAACNGEPGVDLTLLISRLFRFSVAAVVPVGLWATLLCCPQIHRLARPEDCGHAQPAWREVRTWRVGEAGPPPPHGRSCIFPTRPRVPSPLPLPTP